MLRAFLPRLAGLVRGMDASSSAAAAPAMFVIDVRVTNVGAIGCGTAFGDVALEAVWGPVLVMGFAGLPILDAATTGRLHLVLSGYPSDRPLLGAVEHALRTAAARRTGRPTTLTGAYSPS